MNVTIMGTGYVGLVTGACLADMGHHVFCLDRDEHKIGILNGGGVPIHEAGLKKIIESSVIAGRLRFSTDVEAGVAFGRIIFIAAGTPANEDGGADITDVLAAARDIGRHMNEFKVIVNKSTVPVGTAERITAQIAAQLTARALATLEFSVASNPEFLKEGTAVEDFMRPDRIVIGVAHDAAALYALSALRELYAPLDQDAQRMCVMAVKSAELTKYASNAMLATRISFMNDLAILADAVGADIEQVRQGMGSDRRIGSSFLHAGAGYGGGCFPKDVRALARDAREHGHPLRVLEAVDAVNDDQKHVLVDRVFAHFGHNLNDKCFALWGLAFKPETSDMREAPSRTVVTALLRAGARIKAHDPVAMEEARRVLQADLTDCPGFMDRIDFVASPMGALQRADALLILTEWNAYRHPDLAELKAALREPLIFDGRNLYDPQQMERAGIRYVGIGRASERFRG